MQWQIQGTPCYNKLTRGLAILLLTLCASPVNAGALYFYEFGSPTETGFAGAGMAARAQDAGTVFTNPAGMTRFSDSATLVSGGLLYLHAPFDASKQTTISGTSGSTTEFLPYGSFAYIHSVSDRLKLGVSAQNNFGLALDWGTNWVGRYSGTKVAILAPQVQPTVSFRVNKWLSLGAGAGLTLGYLDAKLRINQERENRGDGKMEYDDTDFAVQGNFGIMLEPGSRTRIGLRYLTETDLDFEDDPDFSRMAPSTEAITDRIGKLDLGMKMPQSVMLGVFHDLNDKWAILGSVGWEDWSEFGRVSVSVNDSSEVTNDLKFDDVWHFGVGAQYKYKPRWIINTGVAYDTGLADDKHRSIDIPMSKMYRVGIGTEYRKRNDLTIGAAMDILYMGDMQIDNDSGGGRVDGQYENVFLSFFTVYAKWQ